MRPVLNSRQICIFASWGPRVGIISMKQGCKVVLRIVSMSCPWRNRRILILYCVFSLVSFMKLKCCMQTISGVSKVVNTLNLGWKNNMCIFIEVITIFILTVEEKRHHIFHRNELSSMAWRYQCYEKGGASRWCDKITSPPLFTPCVH